MILKRRNRNKRIDLLKGLLIGRRKSVPNSVISKRSSKWKTLQRVDIPFRKELLKFRLELIDKLQDEIREELYRAEDEKFFKIIKRSLRCKHIWEVVGDHSQKNSWCSSCGTLRKRINVLSTRNRRVYERYLYLKPKANHGK